MRWFAVLMLTALLGIAPAGAITINEINYDDAGIDHEEFIEIYHAGGGDFSAYDLVLYNGNDGAEYDRITIGTIPVDGYLVIGVAGVPNVDITFPGATNQIQNGAPDGIAIVQNGVSCDQFLSYEGVFDAVGGECDAVTSTDIGVADAQSTPEDDIVLQRLPNGTGSFAVTGDGSSNGVAEDGTPGLENVDPGPGAPTCYGKLTATQINTETAAIELCAAGGDGALTLIITDLATNGTLEDGGTPIVAVPHPIVGDLTYDPDTAYSGLDHFSFKAVDSLLQESDTVRQEVAVQANTVVISEIMYSPSSFQSTYEYIEVYNNSGSAVALTRLDTDRNTTTNTNDNLLGESIPANSMRIITMDNTVAYPDSAEDFRCEWSSLREADIIRIDVDNWEYLFSNADPDNCNAASGSRVLLFGTGGTLLDSVDLSIRTSIDCDGTSYAIDPFLLSISACSTLNTECNDSTAPWECSSEFGDGQLTGQTGDTGSPGYVPTLFESPTYDPPCYGSCCLPDGSCVDGVTESECLVDYCGQEFTLDSTCPYPGTCDPIVGKKCCVATGVCLDLGECECLLFNGDWNGAATCASPGQSTGECPVEVALVINELDYNTPSTDEDEFIELYSVTPGESLAGWSLEFFNGNDFTGDNLYRTVDLATTPGGIIPGDGYLVVGSTTVPNVDLEEWTTNAIQNGGFPEGDGVALLFNGLVVEAMAYDADSNGFYAVGGDADGTFLTDIVVSDGSSTTLQKIPDGGAWDEITCNTPGESNIDCGDVGACCQGETCSVEYPDVCTNGGGIYKGDGTTCDPNPCIPRGACCLPDGSCQEDETEDDCLALGGTWNGEDTICMDIAAFVACLDPDGGPDMPVPAGCDAWDLDTSLSVDLGDFALLQQQICVPDPVGACCRPNGECIEINEFDCADAYGPDAYEGDGVLCISVTCPEPTPGDILINEIWADDPSTDTNEFIELWSDTIANLAGYSLIVVDGDTGGDTNSAVYRVVNFQADFDGTHLLAPYFTMGTGPDAAPPVSDVDLDATFGDADTMVDELQNGSQTYALVFTTDIAYCTSSGVPDASCTGADNQLTQASYDTITGAAIDTVATRIGDFDDVYFLAPLVQDSGAYVFDYAQRIPDHTDTDVPEDWETVYGSEMSDPSDPSTPDAVNVSQGTIAGACCIGMTCAEMLYDECASTSGLWTGYGSSCTPVDPCNCGLIADAPVMEFPETEPVCLTGVIVSNTYDLVNSTNSKNMFVQDPTGTNGVIVYGSNAEIDALLAVVALGDEIELRGTKEEYFNSQEVTGPFTVEYLSSPGTPTPFEVSVADLKDLWPNNGQYLSTLIKVMNAEFAVADQGNAFAYGSYTIHDATTPTDTMTVRIANSEAGVLPIIGTTIPTGPVNIVGMCAIYSDAYQVQPRVAADITP
ncbi:MAG: lamin tail domain-containing protein [bacterium]|nr:lamin tail domain-containing protein [bacterium]